MEHKKVPSTVDLAKRKSKAPNQLLEKNNCLKKFSSKHFAKPNESKKQTEEISVNAICK